MMTTLLTRLFTGSLLAGAALLLATSCASTPEQPQLRAITPNTTFSLNMAEVPDDWPIAEDWALDEEVVVHQEKIYNEYGKPDFFWLMWRRDGRPMTHREMRASEWVTRKNSRQNRVNVEDAVDIAWMYLDEDVMFSFSPSGAKKLEITDPMRTIVEFGDPHEIKETVNMQGRDQLSYQYYDEGKVFYYENGKQTKVDTMPRLEGYFDRR